MYKNGAKNEEILGICFQNKSNKIINRNSNIFEFCYYIHKRLAKMVSNKNKSILKNEILLPYFKDVSVNTVIDIIRNKEIRELYIKNGEEIAKHYLLKITNNEENI